MSIFQSKNQERERALVDKELDLYKRQEESSINEHISWEKLRRQEDLISASKSYALDMARVMKEYHAAKEVRNIELAKLDAQLEIKKAELKNFDAMMKVKEEALESKRLVIENWTSVKNNEIDRLKSILEQLISNKSVDVNYKPNISWGLSGPQK